MKFSLWWFTNDLPSMLNRNNLRFDVIFTKLIGLSIFRCLSVLVFFFNVRDNHFANYPKMHLAWRPTSGDSPKARFILTAFLPQRQDAGIFLSAMKSDLSHSSAWNAGESRVLPPAGQRHRFSGKHQSKNEFNFGVFPSRFFPEI